MITTIRIPIGNRSSESAFFADGAGGCRLVYTEQGAYYGDEQDVKNRKLGCEELFGKLEAELSARP